MRTLSCLRRALCTELLPGRRKSTCHFLNYLQLVPLTGLGQAASAAAGPPDRGCVNSAALCGRRRGPGAQRAATRCSARSRRWAGSGGVAARLRQGCRVSSEPAPHVPRAWKPRPQEITPHESGQKPRPYGLRTASFRVRLRSLKGILSRVNRTARGWGRALERPHFRIIKHCS